MAEKRLAIIGARGVGNHGGFETVVGELAPRLRDHGHEVYCSVRNLRSNGDSNHLGGVRLIAFPLSFPASYSIGKIFEVFYDSYFLMKCRFQLKCDVVYCLGVASGISLLLTMWHRSLTAVNVDGLEWTRAKFGRLERLFLRLSFITCCIGADRIVIDNKQLMEYVPKKYRRKTVYIPYGAPTRYPGGQSDSKLISAICEEYGCAIRDFWLVVARLEPENNIHTIIEAYMNSDNAWPLLVVGGSSSREYEERLRNLIRMNKNGERVILTGPIYERERLTAIREACGVYVHGHSVGGTNPSLLEAMSAGNAIVAHDNAFNHEVCGDAAIYFDSVHSLESIMRSVPAKSSELARLGQMAKVRADSLYRWDDVVSEHERLFADAN